MPIKFYRTRRFYFIVVGLIALTVTPTLIYYEMSYNSVNGTAVQLVSGSRTGFYSYITTFYLEIHVWSYATSTDTHVANPTFGLVVDSFPFATVTGGSGTWQANGYISYSLKFETSDLSVARAVGQSTTNHLILSMDGIVSAGWFSEELTRSDSATWTFSG